MTEQYKSRLDKGQSKRLEKMSRRFGGGRSGNQVAAEIAERYLA
jgi:hypothetical protein